MVDALPEARPRSNNTDRAGTGTEPGRRGGSILRESTHHISGTPTRFAFKRSQMNGRSDGGAAPSFCFFSSAYLSLSLCLHSL